MPLRIEHRRVKSYWATRIKGSTILIHRLIAEIILGRKLHPDEQVHHLDGNGLNNHPDNLEVMFASEHGRLSGERRRKTEEPF